MIDKYVGETEKNLERIFTEAAGVNAGQWFNDMEREPEEVLSEAERSGSTGSLAQEATDSVPLV